MCSLALETGYVKLRCVAFILGKFSLAIQTIPFAQAHYRSMKKFCIDHSKNSDLDLNSKCFFCDDARSDLIWWMINFKKSKRKTIFALYAEPRNIFRCFAVSFGAVSNNVTTREPWRSLILAVILISLNCWGPFLPCNRVRESLKTSD